MRYIFLVLTSLTFFYPLHSIEWLEDTELSSSTEVKQGLKVVGNNKGDTVVIWMETTGTSPGIYAAYSAPKKNTWSSPEKISDYTSIYNPSVCINNNRKGFITYAKSSSAIEDTTLFKINFTIDDAGITFGDEFIVNTYFVDSGSSGNTATPITQIDLNNRCLVTSIGQGGLRTAYGPLFEGPLNSLLVESASLFVDTSNPSQLFTRFNSTQSLSGNIVGIWNAVGYIVNSTISTSSNPSFTGLLKISDTNIYDGINGGAFADIDNNANVAAFVNTFLANPGSPTPTSTASGWELFFGNTNGYNSESSFSVNNATNSFLNPPTMEINSFGFGGCIYSTAGNQLNSFLINTDSQTVGDVLPFATGTNPSVSTDDVGNLYAAWIDNTSGNLAGGLFTENTGSWEDIDIISTQLVNTNVATANFSNLSIAATYVGYGVAVYIDSDYKVRSIFFQNPDAPDNPQAFFRANHRYNPTFFEKGIQ